MSLALLDVGRFFRRIEAETGARRETIGRYHAAVVAKAELELESLVTFLRTLNPPKLVGRLPTRLSRNASLQPVRRVDLPSGRPQNFWGVRRASSQSPSPANGGSTLWSLRPSPKHMKSRLPSSYQTYDDTIAFGRTRSVFPLSNV